MKPSLLVTGSLAFDRIAVFKDRFARHIVKEHAHNLNVSFRVEDMKQHFGGTGGNIAYNLSLLGESPFLLAALGHDSEAYLNALKKRKIRTTHVKKFPRLLTATATIMTDMDDNQIASFYPGAMDQAANLKLSSVKGKISMAIIAPNDPKAMLSYTEACFKKRIPFLADPGQAIPAFSSAELKSLIIGAHALVVNDYEWEMIQQKTGWTKNEVLEEVNFLIITEGKEGSKIWCKDATVIEIPAYDIKNVVDPTGCGDAYRAGLMYGYRHEFGIEKSAHVGAWLAARCVEKEGTQNHRISKMDFKKFLNTL